MIAEGFVISAIATAIGLLLASAALDGMQLAVRRDCSTTARAGGASKSTTGSRSWPSAPRSSRPLFAGLPAAIRASRPSLDSMLRDGGRMGTGLAIGRIAWGLVVAEVALACLLLGVAALMTKSVLNATVSDVGVETDDIMTARVGLTDGTYVEREDQVRFWDTLLTRVQSQPGIQSASVTNSLPGHGTARRPGIGRGPRLRRRLDEAVRQLPDREPARTSRPSASLPRRAGCSTDATPWTASPSP